MNHAVISFTGSGHQDPWGNFGGTLKGDMPLTLSGKSQGTVDVNEIIINNSRQLLLQPGESGTLFFSFAATQVPVKLSTFTLTLASSAQDETTDDAADEVEPEPEVPADDDTDSLKPEPEDNIPADEETDEVAPEPQEQVMMRLRKRKGWLLRQAS